MSPNVIDKLAWLCLVEGKVLAARSRGKTHFYLPGGKRDLGESDTDALVREIREELSVDLNPDSLVFVHTFHQPADGKPLGTLVKLTCYTGSYLGTLSPSSEIEEIAFLDPDLDASRCSEALRNVMQWLRLHGYLKP